MVKWGYGVGGVEGTEIDHNNIFFQNFKVLNQF